jgi:uncharacterized SAM-binding protein YcdF (DUF218 family)
MSFNVPPFHAPDPEPAARSVRRPRTKRRRNRLIALGLLVLLVVLGAFAFFGVGRWLVVEDPLAPADAIVALSGQLPERATEAARIYDLGDAKQVWITQQPTPAAELAKLGVHFVGEDFYDEEVMIVLGVPVDTMRVLDPPAANTEAEVDEISGDMRAEGLTSVIIVTSKPHTRRVRAIWNRRAGPSLRAIVRYPDSDPYDAAHWWRHTRDALDVVRELLGLLNAWAGFPLRAR